ncbi:MAG: pilus assembly protein [Salinisphaera sp.]|nr:pilus assembly protein [Salinisphaera sp.]
MRLAGARACAGIERAHVVARRVGARGFELEAAAARAGRAAGDATGEASKWWLWREGQPIAGTGGFRDPGVWADDPAVTDPVSNQASRGLPGVSKRPRMYIEQLRAFRPRDLNPDTRARAQGAGLYRITARASGGSPGAMVIVQVLYRKRF